MIAIECHYIAPTNYRPMRITAQTCNGHKLTISSSTASTATDDTGRPEVECRYVAQALADKMKWGPLGDGGGTKRGYVFCFRDRGQS